MNGKHSKVEGVLIFILPKIDGQLEGIKDDEIFQFLNNTYNILRRQANITKESLKTKKKFMIKSIEFSCRDLKDIKDSCLNKIGGKKIVYQVISGIMFFIISIVVLRLIFARTKHCVNRVAPI